MVITSTSSRCPNPACSSAPEPELAKHGSFPTKRGRRSRQVCKRCGQTFSATRGTPYWRMRRPRADLDRALHMSVEGVSASGIARVLSVSVSTVTRWLDKAGAHAQAFSDAHIRIGRPVEMQLDEINTYGLQRATNAWSFNGIEVWSRLWASQRVGRRTLRTTLLFVRQIAAVCGHLIDPTLFSTDEFKYYPVTIRRVSVQAARTCRSRIATAATASCAAARR